MKVILVNGGPHEHGTTWAGLDEIERTLQAEGIETKRSAAASAAADVKRRDAASSAA